MKNELLNNCRGITIVSLLLASPFFLQTQNAYEGDSYGQGYDVELISDSDEAQNRKKRQWKRQKRMKIMMIDNNTYFFEFFIKV